jgi:hypothetical protein
MHRSGLWRSRAIPSLESERGSQTAERAWRLGAISHAYRLDPHAACPDTRTRSLNVYSVSKNVPDCNPCGLRLHANSRQVGLGAFLSLFPALRFFRLPRRVSSRPPAGNASRWAAHQR